ncbi:MAG: RQC-minor-1 family DNA-binding protein [Actinomycetota bacterium]
MSARRVNRVPVNLHPQESGLSKKEIRIILRAADEIIMEGGRNLLAKLLKGSKEKVILQRGLENTKNYGYFKNLSVFEIISKIDWLIINRYLKIEYDYRLPLIVFAPEGWEIEKDTYTDEIIEEFDKLIESGVDYYNMSFLKDAPRDMVFLLLEKIRGKKDPKYIPILKQWKKIDYKKVRARINSVIKSIKNSKAKKEI